MKKLVILFCCCFASWVAAQDNMVTITHVDTMTFSQENFDLLDQEIWKVYYARRFEATLPVFKAMWDRGIRDYAATQDSMAYRFLCYGKSTYAQWLTLLGRYEEGLYLFEEALTETESYFGPIMRLSYAYVGLGLAYSQFGDPYRALWAQNQAARIIDLHIKPGHPNYHLVGNKLGNLARVYGELNQPEKAIQLFEDAEEAYLTANSYYGALSTIWGRGRIAALCGNIELARTYVQKAHEFQKRYSVDLLSSIIILDTECFIDVEAGEARKAFIKYAEVEKLIGEYSAQNVNSSGRYNFANIYSVYAGLAIQHNDILKANTLIAKGKEANSKSTNDENNILGIKFRLLEARIAAAEKDYAHAAKMIERVVGILTNQKEVDWLSPEVDSALLVPSPLLAQAFRTSAEIQAYAGTYSVESVLANCDAGKAVLRKIQLSYAPDVAMDRLLKENQSLYDLSIEKTFSDASTLGTSKSVEAYFLAIEEARDQQLLSAIGTREDIAYGIPSTLSDAENTARQKLRAYERLLTIEQGKKEKNQDLIISYQSYLRSSRNTVDSITAVIKRSFPAYYELKFREQPLKLSQVQQVLSRDEAMLCYYLTESGIYGLMISSQEAVPFKSDLKSYEIEAFIKTLQSPVVAPSIEWQQQSFSLYEKLLSPIKARPFSRLILVPDKTLNFLAWPALLTSLGGSGADWRSLPYLIRSINLRQEASAGVYVRQRVTRNTRQIYAYAGFAPAYDGQPFSKGRDSRSTYHYDLFFPEAARQMSGPLVYNGDEVRFATSLFETPVAEVGSGATEAFFKEVAGEANILHVASHGMTSAYDPAESHLLFSQSQDDQEDGLLHAWEIYGMKIPADLTVLSACQTGTGVIRNGAGVLSLARAFRYAGSKDVVMSLWSVNDRSTYQVIREFFSGLKQERDKAVALQEAMIYHLSTEKNDEYLHPYYWAGFSLVGPGEVLDEGKIMDSKWWIALVVILLFMVIIGKRFWL